MIDPHLFKLIVAIGVFGVNKTTHVQYWSTFIISTFISLFFKSIDEKVFSRSVDDALDRIDILNLFTNLKSTSRDTVLKAHLSLNLYIPIELPNSLTI